MDHLCSRTRGIQGRAQALGSDCSFESAAVRTGSPRPAALVATMAKCRRVVLGSFSGSRASRNPLSLRGAG